MMKVALYARVSTKEQETDNQIIRLREYARVRGFEVVDVYEDTASGANPNRPNLDRLLAVARDALDWLVKRGYSVGRLIEKALNRME